MKKIYLILFIFIFCFVLFILLKRNNCHNIQAEIYFINNKKYCLLIANNQEKWKKGLMNIKKPVNFDGMIFIFPNKEIKSFWNQNTYVDLDIYWMNDDKITGKSFLPSILRSKEVVFVGSSEKVNRVVEIIK